MSKKTCSISCDFCGLLAIAFIVLKLCGVIAWSWGWVLSPLWLPIALFAAIAAIASAIAMWIGN